MVRLYEALFHPVNITLSGFVFALAYIFNAGVFAFVLPVVSLFLFSRIPFFKKQVIAQKKSCHMTHLQKKAQKGGWIFHHVYQNFQKEQNQSLWQTCPFYLNPILHKQNLVNAQKTQDNFLTLLNKLEQEILLWDKSLALKKPYPIKKELNLKLKQFFQNENFKYKNPLLR